MLHVGLLVGAGVLAWHKWDYPTNSLHRLSRILLAYNAVGSLLVGVQAKHVGIFLFTLVIALISGVLFVQLNRQQP